MTGRHRKARPSTSKAAAVRVAIAGAVLGGGDGGLAGHASAATDGEWDLVSRCESGGDWSINTGNGYQGGLQFAPSTWSTYGGGQYASEAQRATKEQQIAVAERVLAQQGRGAWPVCGGALSGATPRNGQSAAPAPQPVVGTVSDAAAPVGADPPPDAETPEELQPPGAPAAIGPMAPTDAPLPPQVEAPIGVPELTVAPTGEQDTPVDSPPEQPPSVSNAAAEPPGPDVALAAETQADNGTPQDAVLLPPADPEPSDASPEPTAQLVQASATVSAYDTAKEAALIALVHRYAGTPYISGGDSPAGTDCSGLASWLANIATGRPVFGDRFSTHNEEAELVERGFRYGAAPRTLVIGWNDHHTAITLADGTSVASGEGGGIRIGGGGAYQAQFDHHMYIPTTRGPVNRASAPVDDKQASLDPPAPVEGTDL